MNDKQLVDYLPEFFDVFEKQLLSDQVRWGDTWKARPREAQEERAFARFLDYFDQFRYGNQSVPWLKVMGEAFICWVRENHPDYDVV